MAGSEQTKTEQPTPFRLQEARERGQVPRSTELTGVLVTIAFAVAFAASSSALAAAVAGAFRRVLLMAGNAPAPSAGLMRWLQHELQPAWQALLPILLAMLVAAVLANLIQTGPVFSTTPLKPDFNRLNPVEGMKRVVSLRVLWELFKLCLKLALLGGLAWMIVPSLDHRVAAAAFSAPSDLGLLLRSTFMQVTVWVLLVLAMAALLDLLFARREYIRKLRMSRSELQDEVKRREGDPGVRQKRRRLITELLKQSRSMRRLPEADILLTNPTHLAVALQYRPATMRAPVVLSKGTGTAAAHMRRLAARHGVPCLRSPELARALFRECRIDQAVPDHLYSRLAPVYRWLMQRPGSRVFS